MLSLGDDPTGQLRGVGNAVGQDGGGGALPGTDDAHDGQLFPLLDQGFHICRIAGHVFPYGILFVIAVELGGIHQPEFQLHQFLVGPLQRLSVQHRLLSLHDLGDHILQLTGILQTQGIDHIVRHGAGIVQHQDHFIVACRPTAPNHLVLGGEHIVIVDHLIEYVGVHIGGHGHIACDLTKQCGRVHLQDVIRVGAEDQGPDTVAVFDGLNGVTDGIVMLLQMRLKGPQVISADLREHVADHGLLTHNALRQLGRFGHGSTKGCHGGTHIRCFRLQGQRVVGEGILLDLINVLLKTGGQRHDQRNADDADGPGKGGQEGSGQFGPQIVKAQRQRRQEGHGGTAHVFVGGFVQNGFIHRVGVGIVDDTAVLYPDDPAGIFLGQLRVVGNHDHQPVTGYRLQQIHDLHTGFRVQCAGGFIRQQNIGIVDQCPGDGHPLHLTAGHLIGLFVQLIAQAHILQSFLRPLPPFAPGDAGDGKCQFHIGQHGLVGDQIVALEYEADGVVPIGVPVPVGIFFGRDTVDDQITAVISVQTADHIQKRGLTGAAGTQNGDKFLIAQVQAHAVQGSLNQLSGDVFLMNILDLKHRLPPSSHNVFYSLSSVYEQI